VSKEEYEKVYRKIKPDATPEDYDKVWKKMDADGDGNLTVSELASYYGFDFDSDKNEMDDDQILEALKIQAQLDVMAAEAKQAEEAKKEEAKKKAAAEEKAKPAERDATIKKINIEEKNKKKNEPVDQVSVDLLDSLSLGDFSSKKSGPSVDSCLADKSLKVRVEDEKGEMPLHKLARYKPETSKMSAFKNAFDKIVELTQKESENSFESDLNHQDNSGKTPLAMAVEHKNLEIIELLFKIEGFKPDLEVTTAAGWTHLHIAVNTGDLEVVKCLVKHMRLNMKKDNINKIVNCKDKANRVPLHIAAYKCTEDMVHYLCTELKAKNDTTDNAGNVPSKLAERAGRRKSKELIDDLTQNLTQISSS